MINLLFILLFYEFQLSKDSNSYFQNLVFLKYGFNRKSDYQFHIKYRTCNMVFGLATEDEIKNISKFKQNQEYCSGKYPLSKIQYLINRSYPYEQFFSGRIISKSLLVPYLFTCNKTYGIGIKLRYQNNPYYLDSRCQYAQDISILFLVLLSIYSILFIIFCIISSQKDHYHSAYGLFIFWFLLQTCTDGLAPYLFYTDHLYDEYFNRKLTYYYEKNVMSNSYLALSNIYSSTMLLTICYMAFIYQKGCNICNSVYLAVYISLITIKIIFICVSYNRAVYIIYLIIYFFCAAFLTCSPPLSKLFKIGLSFHFIGSYVSIAVGKLIAFETIETYQTHMVAFIMLDIFVITHLIFIIFVFISVFYCKDFDCINITCRESNYCYESNYNFENSNQNNQQNTKYTESNQGYLVTNI